MDMKPIIPPVSIVDSLGLITLARPSNKLFRRIRRQFGTRRTVHRVHKGRLRWKLRFHQPTDDELRMIARWAEREGWLLNEVHVALDFPTASRADAAKVHEWFLGRLMWPRRRASSLGHSQGQAVDYTSRRTWRCISYAAYSDRESKVTGGPCFH